MSFSILLPHARLSKETLVVEVMLGVMSAFHAHKWILQAAAYLFWTFSRILLSYSFSPFPAFTAVGLCLLFIGIYRLQDQDEEVNGVVGDDRRDSDDSEADVDEGEESIGDDSPMERDSTETEVDQEGEEVDHEDKEGEDSERGDFIAALLDQLVRDAVKSGLSFKGSVATSAEL